VGGGHAVTQIIGHITNGIKLRIAGLGARFKMGRLRDWTTAQHTHAKQSVFFGWHY
jgi:hypothetical protein